MSFPDLWRALRDEGAAAGAGGLGLRLRLATSAPQARAHAAVRPEDGGVGCLIELPQAAFAAVRLPPPARRLRAVVLAAADAGFPPGRDALLVELRDEDFEDLFALLVQDVADAALAASEPRAAAESAAAALQRWSRFMDRDRPHLTEAEVKGLIGELCVLERLASGVGPAAALDAWRSPAGAYRDFEAAAFTVEVKAFSPSQGATVRVNDPLQLEPDPGVPLYLACQELGASDEAAHSLAGHAARVSAAFEKDAADAERFDLLLAAAGFPQVGSLALYERQRWRPGPLHAFGVAAGFPRIRPSDVPAGATAVRFSLEVAALAPFRVDADAVIGPLPQPGGAEGGDTSG